jgi:hypothetical protein
MKRLIIIVSAVVAALTLAVGGVASGSASAVEKTPVSTATLCC